VKHVIQRDFEKLIELLVVSEQVTRGMIMTMYLATKATTGAVWPGYRQAPFLSGCRPPMTSLDGSRLELAIGNELHR
jgi:hypothetical protein